jgi:hypothetical protein
MLKEWREQVLPLNRTMRKSGRFTMCLPGTIKGACEREVVTGSDSGADRLWKKEC